MASRKFLKLVVDLHADSRWDRGMDLTPIQHGTLLFERRIPAPVEAVFRALADPTQRAEWGAPSDTAVIIYDHADFRPGGVDRFRCGARTNPNVHGTTWYLQIVENRRIVSAETVEMNGKTVSASLTTVELTADSDATLLKSTNQVASFMGSDMIRNHEIGHNGSLDQLLRYFARSHENERPK